MSTINLRLEPALKRFVEQSALDEQKTISEWLRQALSNMRKRGKGRR